MYSVYSLHFLVILTSVLQLSRLNLFTVALLAMNQLDANLNNGDLFIY